MVLCSDSDKEKYAQIDNVDRKVSSTYVEGTGCPVSAEGTPDGFCLQDKPQDEGQGEDDEEEQEGGNQPKFFSLINPNLLKLYLLIRNICYSVQVVIRIGGDSTRQINEQER